MCRRRDGVAPTQDDREDVNAVFMDKYPKAILIESGIALVEGERLRQIMHPSA